MRSVHLPISGIAVTLRPMTGVEELMILEAADDASIEAELGLAVALAERLAEMEDRDRFPGLRDLPVIDLDTLLLRLRQGSLGDHVRGEIICPVSGCGERVQISFGVNAFLEHVEQETVPPPSSDVVGWSAVPRGPDAIRFRLPTPRDLTEAVRTANPEQELARRCIHPPNATAVQRRRAERAMEAQAPLVVRDLQGHCPACDTAVTVHFDIRRFCLRELRHLAACVYDDVDLLARSYHWSEASILALSSDRRARYAERARYAVLAA